MCDEDQPLVECFFVVGATLELEDDSCCSAQFLLDVSLVAIIKHDA